MGRNDAEMNESFFTDSLVVVDSEVLAKVGLIVVVVDEGVKSGDNDTYSLVVVDSKVLAKVELIVVVVDEGVESGDNERICKVCSTFLGTS